MYSDRIIDKGNFFFIPKFLKFQYPNGLNSKKDALLAVRTELVEYKLLQYVNELYGDNYASMDHRWCIDEPSVQDKDKDTDKDKETDKDIYLDCVYLTPDERLKLDKRFGEAPAEAWIKRLNDYIQSKGKKYRSHYHTILVWADKDTIKTVPGEHDKKIETTKKYLETFKR